MLRRIDREGAPAAAEIEHRLAGLQPQSPAAHLELVDLRLGEIIVPFREIGAGVDHLRIEPERIEGVRHVIVIGDVLLVLSRAAVALVLLADLVQRPRPAARGEQEFCGGLHEQRLAQELAHVARPHRRTFRHEIEDRAIADVEARRGPEIAERLHVRAPHQARHHAFVGDRDGERVARPIGRNQRAVPELKAELQGEAAMHVIEKRRSASRRPLDMDARSFAWFRSRRV